VLLYQLYQSGAPTSLAAMFDLDVKEERNMRGRVNRDMRIVEDEYKRILPAAHCGIHRSSGRWHIELAPPDSTARSRQDMVPIESLAHLVVSGLLQAGIADATVWGVHRYANEVLARVFGAKLPDEVTPFILADAFVRLTNGFIRPMRRRRLRWDRSDGDIPARGKRGWVNFALSENGMPVTLDELGDLLRRWYQDYASYVLAQLNLDAEEEGDFHCSAVWYPGVPHRIPPILVPADWELNPTADNVSDEIKLLVSKIIAMAQDNTLKSGDLLGVPWLIELTQRHSYGEDIWGDGSRASTRSTHNTTAPESANTGDGRSNGRRRLEKQPAPKTRSTHEVDEMLSKFL